MLLVKNYNVTMEEDDNQLEFICQLYNGFVTSSGRSRELLYITFLHSGISTLGIYPEYPVPNNTTFIVLSKIKYNAYIRDF